MLQCAKGRNVLCATLVISVLTLSFLLSNQTSFRWLGWTDISHVFMRKQLCLHRLFSFWVKLGLICPLRNPIMSVALSPMIRSHHSFLTRSVAGIRLNTLAFWRTWESAEQALPTAKHMRSFFTGKKWAGKWLSSLQDSSDIGMRCVIWLSPLEWRVSLKSSGLVILTVWVMACLV